VRTRDRYAAERKFCSTPEPLRVDAMRSRKFPSFFQAFLPTRPFSRGRSVDRALPPNSDLRQSKEQISPPRGFIADYLADRERLEGRARLVFLRLLRERFGFRLTPRTLTAARFGWLALILPALGLTFEILSGSVPESVIAWLSIAAVGGLLALALGHQATHWKSIEPEFEWRAYCTLVRPLIVQRQPGLLDRNLIAVGEPETFELDQRREISAVFQHRGVDFLLPALIGWSLGAICVVVARIAIGSGGWTWALPICGVLLAPIAWSLLRLVIFRRVIQTTRDSQ